MDASPAIHSNDHRNRWWLRVRINISKFHVDKFTKQAQLTAIIIQISAIWRARNEMTLWLMLIVNWRVLWNVQVYVDWKQKDHFGRIWQDDVWFVQYWAELSSGVNDAVWISLSIQLRSTVPVRILFYSRLDWNHVKSEQWKNEEITED